MTTRHHNDGLRTAPVNVRRRLPRAGEVAALTGRLDAMQWRAVALRHLVTADVRDDANLANAMATLAIDLQVDAGQVAAILSSTRGSRRARAKKGGA
jgi:hypothetical protein